MISLLLLDSLRDAECIPKCLVAFPDVLHEFSNFRTPSLGLVMRVLLKIM